MLAGPAGDVKGGRGGGAATRRDRTVTILLTSLTAGRERNRSIMRVVACARPLGAVSSVLVSVVLVAAPAFDAAGGSCSSASYEVRPGDGWFAIADDVDVEVRKLLDVNDAGLDDVLFPGDRVCLPEGADAAAACRSTATVRSGDSWSLLARRAGVTLNSLVSLNGGDAGRTIHPGEQVCLPAGAAAGDAYTVASGDSWSWIAERAGTSMSALLDVNDASSSDSLFPGQQIRLPAGASQPTDGSSAGGAAGSRSVQVDLAALPTQGPCWYHDTWGDGRSGGRYHVGTDVFTVPGEYVYAVVDGTLTSRKWAQPGNISGNAWRLTAADGTYFFYAHLADFAPGLGEGSRVRAGQIIGWVGSTGNTTVDHLHFEVHPGGGGPVNPYPILRAEGGACNRGTPYTQPGGWVPD